MIAKSTVYLNAEGKPVPEGDESARTLLVREGTDIPDVTLDKYEGARELAEAGESKAKTKAADKEGVQHREPRTEDRDPKLYEEKDHPKTRKH